jgi:hypothetical protein
MFGTVGALRGGSFVVTNHGVHFKAARVVTDAVADGAQYANRTRLRLRGRGVPPAQLTLKSAGRPHESPAPSPAGEWPYASPLRLSPDPPIERPRAVG